MDEFVLVQRKRIRCSTVRQEKETFAKEIEMTLARAQSLPVKCTVVKIKGVRKGGV